MGLASLIWWADSGVGSSRFRSELLEVVVEELRTLGEDGQGRVVAHGAHGLDAVLAHGQHQLLHVLPAVAEGELALQHRLVIGLRR
jgi:hypothetical protein